MAYNGRFSFCVCFFFFFGFGVRSKKVYTFCVGPFLFAAHCSLDQKCTHTYTTQMHEHKNRFTSFIKCVFLDSSIIVGIYVFCVQEFSFCNFIRRFCCFAWFSHIYTAHTLCSICVYFLFFFWERTDFVQHFIVCGYKC